MERAAEGRRDDLLSPFLVYLPAHLACPRDCRDCREDDDDFFVLLVGCVGVVCVVLIAFGIPPWPVFAAPNMLGVLVCESFDLIPWSVFYFYWPLHFVLHVVGWIGALFFAWMVAVWGANRMTGCFSGGVFWRAALALYAGVQGMALLGFRLLFF